MAPKGPDELICACRPRKPCFVSIQKLVASARLGKQDTEQVQPKWIDERHRDIREPDPALDVVPTVHCEPPEQSDVPARYPGAPCFTEGEENGDNKTDEKPNAERQTAQIKRKFHAEATKSNCPCQACGEEALFETCGHPFAEFERNYAKRVETEDFTSTLQLPHDCREHRDRPRDRAPGDPVSDFDLKSCKECPCCLAFRPHPPATLATTDLYRTCGLPKRFKYPSWFKGYGISCQHPLYRTTNSEFGRYPPSIHTVPTVYYPMDRTYSNIISQIGPYKDKGLRTTGSIWDAYTYYDFW